MATAQQPPSPETLPHNVEAEAALLGALLIENKLVDVIADRLEAKHFYEPLHGRIFSAIVNQVTLGRAANPVTLKPLFDADESMKEVGGPAYLAQLTGSGAAVIGARDFADQILELAQLRAMIAVGRAIADRAADTSEEVSFAGVAAFAETQIAEIAGETDDGVVEMSFAEAAKEALEPSTASAPGVSSGIEGLDRALGPIKPQQLVIVAGRPGMGKSTLARNYALSVAKHQGEDGKRRQGVLFFTHEMSRDEVVKAMLSDLSFNGHSGINHESIATDQLTTEQRRTLARITLEFEDLPLQIVDAGGMRVSRLAASVRRWKRRFTARGVDLALVVVDYLQLVQSDERENNLTTTVTKVSQALKATMKRNEVGGLVLSQLSRKVEERDDKRPHLSDLRESGSIEQDADGVCFLFRHEYYLEMSEPDADSSDPKKQEERARWERAMEVCRGRIEFIVAKRRGRKIGVGRGQWHGAFQAIR